MSWDNLNYLKVNYEENWIEKNNVLLLTCWPKMLKVDSQHFLMREKLIYYWLPGLGAAQPLVLSISVPEEVIVKLPGGKTTDGFDRKKSFLYWQGQAKLKVLHYTITCGKLAP